jgi:hypothetical protein
MLLLLEISLKHQSLPFYVVQFCPYHFVLIRERGMVEAKPYPPIIPPMDLGLEVV